MLRLNGFRAWITVDHKPLETYNIEINSSQNTATCWIASTAGKAFGVTWQDQSRVRPFASSGRVTVDGISCGGKVIPPTGQSKSNKARRDGIRTSPTSVRPFTFGTLELTDDDTYLDSSVSQSLGEIKLSVHRVLIEGHSDSRGHWVPTEAQSVVHERSKKATSHRVKLGDEVKCQRRKTTVVRDVDSEPVVTFIFKYRSLDLLKAMDIVPKTDAAVAKRARRGLKRPRDDAITSDDEVKSLVLERPHSRTRSRKLKKIKLEVTPKLESPFVPGEVIDLT